MISNSNSCFLIVGNCHFGCSHLIFEFSTLITGLQVKISAILIASCPTVHFSDLMKCMIVQFQYLLSCILYCVTFMQARIVLEIHFFFAYTV